VFAPKENALPKDFFNLQTKTIKVGPNFLVFSDVAPNGEDKTPQGKSRNKCLGNNDE
jgi:hypothetical protein